VANTRPSVNKRRKEANRREKKAAKAEKRAARAAEKSARSPVAPSGDEDPDIAGIVPGPQPLPWAEFADIEPEEESEEQEEGQEENAS
jgi:hypothetical protein